MEELLREYLPIIIFLGIAVALGLVLMLAAAVLAAVCHSSTLALTVGQWLVASAAALSAVTRVWFLANSARMTRILRASLFLFDTHSQARGHVLPKISLLAGSSAHRQNSSH